MSRTLFCASVVTRRKVAIASATSKALASMRSVCKGDKLDEIVFLSSVEGAALERLDLLDARHQGFSIGLRLAGSSRISRMALAQ